MIANSHRMLRKYKIFLFITVILSYGLSVEAADLLTWNDCVKEAAKKNPDILSGRETVQSSDYKAKAAYSGFWPQIAGTLNYNTGNSSTFSAISPAPVGQSSSGTSNDFYSTSISAQQNVFSGFHDTALVNQGKASRDVSKTTLESTKVQVSYDLKAAFASLLYAQNYSKLADNIIKRREENLDLVELRFEGGMENKGSALLSKAFLSQAMYEKILARHSIEVSRQQLAKVLGKENSDDLGISGTIPIERPLANPDFIEIAMQTPAYRQAVAQEKYAKASVTSAKSQFSPNVNVFATASRQGTTFPPNGDRHSFGLNVSIPVFNGANNYFTLKSSQSDLAAARFNRESIEKQLLPQLKQAYTAYLDAYEKLKVDRNFLDAATVRAEIARNKYNNGLLSFEDWDIIENDLITKQKTVIQSERDLQFAEAIWQKTQGKGVIQ